MKPIFSSVSFFSQSTLTPFKQSVKRNFQKKTQPTENLQNSFGFHHKLFGLECCFSTNFYQQSEIEDLKLIWQRNPNKNQTFTTLKLTPQPNQKQKISKYNETLRSVDDQNNEQFYRFNGHYLTSPTKTSRMRNLKPNSQNNQNNQNKNKNTNNNPKIQNKTNSGKNSKSPKRDKKSSIASRSLHICNLNQQISEKKLLGVFEQFGDIQSIRFESNNVIISYFDLRDSKKAKITLQGSNLEGNVLDISYINPNKNGSKNINQGTLVVFGLNEFISNKELELIFSQYGQIREIRSTPNKVYHRFVEFFDIREAEIAMNHLNKTKIKTRRIKIELARVVPMKKKKKKNYYNSETKNNNNQNQNQNENQNKKSNNHNLMINNNHNRNLNDKQNLNYYSNSNPNSYSLTYSGNMEDKNYNEIENISNNKYQNGYNYENSNQYLNSNLNPNYNYNENDNQYFYQNEENNNNIEQNQFGYQEGFDFYYSNNSYEYFSQDNF
ncbi:protein mei2-like 4 [Anaeramoeba flamelloides]|uniref:Protein mei2-like 4 n=1 Tax=Anaeramoeba flamelloides TaxID=1746091 RepID=A0ABQ8YAC1_9EUKA|nr:protein mei2-like 4 [Anaeramoeba flamelloides]